MSPLRFHIDHHYVDLSLEPSQQTGICQSSHCILLAVVYEWQKKDKRSQSCAVNAMNYLKKSLFMEYNLYKKNLSFAAAPLQKNSNLYGNRLAETLTQTILYLETHDYQICKH